MPKASCSVVNVELLKLRYYCFGYVDKTFYLVYIYARLPPVCLSEVFFPLDGGSSRPYRGFSGVEVPRLSVVPFRDLIPL